MRIVPEGGSFYDHEVTMILDGQATVEHALPVALLRDDDLTFLPRSETGYTRRLVVGYGGLSGESWW